MKILWQLRAVAPLLILMTGMGLATKTCAQQPLARVPIGGELPQDGDERVEMTAPTRALQLAEPNRVRIDVVTGALKLVTVEQFAWDAKIAGWASINHSESLVPLLHDSAGDAYIEVVPARAGRLQLAVLGVFSDAATFHRALNVYVERSVKVAQKH